MTKISDLIADFTQEQRITGRAKEYIKLCEYKVRTFTQMMDADYPDVELEDVKPLHIKAYIEKRMKMNRESNATLNGNLSTLRVFFKFAIDEGYIEEQYNPIRRTRNLKESRRVIQTFNDEEVINILRCTGEETYSQLRDKVIVIFLFETGIRVSELCDIKNSDISRTNILIHGKGGKERLVYISSTMRRYMRKYEKARQQRFNKRLDFEIEDNYFLDQSAGRLSRSRINKILKKYCVQAGVRDEVRCSPHDCRHYFAQKQLRNGIDVYTLSRLLGHYDTSITAKYLRGLSQEDVLDAGRKYSPLNNVKF